MKWLLFCLSHVLRLVIKGTPLLKPYDVKVYGISWFIWACLRFANISRFCCIAKWILLKKENKNVSEKRKIYLGWVLWIAGNVNMLFLYLVVAQIFIRSSFLWRLLRLYGSDVTENCFWKLNLWSIWAFFVPKK